MAVANEETLSCVTSVKDSFRCLGQTTARQLANQDISIAMVA